MEAKTFKSKVDTWIAVVILGSVAASLCASIALILTMGGTAYILAVFIILGGVVLPLWILAGTHYTVKGYYLKIRSGPFYWSISLNDISDIRESKSALGGPALSLDRLEIVYLQNKTALVSPTNKETFISAIKT